MGNSILLARLQSSKTSESLFDTEAPLTRPLNSDSIDDGGPPAERRTDAHPSFSPVKGTCEPGICPPKINLLQFGLSWAESLRARKAVIEALERELDPSFYHHDEWLSIPEKIRQEGAFLLGLSPDTLTHSTSTAEIVSTVAFGYPLKRGMWSVRPGENTPRMFCVDEGLRTKGYRV